MLDSASRGRRRDIARGKELVRGCLLAAVRGVVPWVSSQRCRREDVQGRGMWIGDSEWARDVKIAGGQKDAVGAVMQAVHGQDNTDSPSGRLTRLQLSL